VEVAVAYIKEIDWKKAALDDLHIPPRKKKAVQALSEAHVKRATTHSYDDVVAGKGQGFSVLLQLVSSPCGCRDSANTLYKRTTWCGEDLDC
jgi:hypothetical protein